MMSNRTRGGSRAVVDETGDSFATLTFERQVAAPLDVLWQVWTQPAARAIWSPPNADVSVEILESETRVGGREISLCKVAGQADMRCECGWLELEPSERSVNYETVVTQGQTQSSALVTAAFSGTEAHARLALTVQLSARAPEMEAGYRQGFGAAMENIDGVARRTMLLQRVIQAPRDVVWNVWMDPETLPQWWGPDGFSCRTDRIDLRTGGDWVFDMIAPDGTVFPNHHRYSEVKPQERIAYQLHWGENGPKHADAWATFDEREGATAVTLGMVFSSEAEYQTAQGFGAVELGYRTLGKLERFAVSRLS